MDMKASSNCASRLSSGEAWDWYILRDLFHCVQGVLGEESSVSFASGRDHTRSAVAGRLREMT